MRVVVDRLCKAMATAPYRVGFQASPRNVRRPRGKRTFQALSRPPRYPDGTNRLPGPSSVPSPEPAAHRRRRMTAKIRAPFAPTQSAAFDRWRRSQFCC
jgi:hypothetical protein